MTQASLLAATDSIEALARGSRVGRLLARPGRYVRTMWHRELTYRRTREEWSVRCETAFGDEMRLRLPASADIYLTGGKSHDSELRLARFLIRHLGRGDGLADVGAHYGYFALLGARLVGPEGYVLALEAAPRTYDTLAENVAHLPQVEARHAAAAAAPGRMTFYEFPAHLSEYNSFDAAQFEQHAWYARHPPRPVEVACVALGEVLAQAPRPVSVVKIDVEGAEALVVAGSMGYLRAAAPTVVMEYLSEDRGNAPHREAAAALAGLGYRPHVIEADGRLAPVFDIEAQLRALGTDSDNIAFAKTP